MSGHHNYSISAISGKKSGASSTLKSQQEKNSQTNNVQTVAYMGPNIGNILNGSASQPTASAVRA